MNTIRIIPRLDIKGPNLVKGIHLEGLRVMGRPEDFAKLYYENGADELMFMDVVASLYNRNSLHDIISRTAQNIFIPITVGGGLRTLEDITEVLRAGADKVSLNTAAVNNPQIIREASRKFGSSTILVAIEAIRQSDGTYLAYTDNAREHTGMDVFEWAKKAEELGAGEIVITSVDKEGTGLGFDVELTKRLSESVGIPVIAHGGAGKMEHVRDVILKGKADAVSVASMFHYHSLIHNAKEVVQGDEGNIEFLRSGKKNKIIEQPASIHELKKYLNTEGVFCRHKIKETA